MVGAYWNEEEQMWHVKIQNGDDPNTIIEDKANIFVNASGVLKYAKLYPLFSTPPELTRCFSKWKWPAIKGRETFQGSMIHSANWDDSIELKGKRIGVIGGGSSAVQIVPNIQPSPLRFPLPLPPAK